MLIPVHIIYWLCFFWLNRRKNIYNNTIRSSILSENLQENKNIKNSINPDLEEKENHKQPQLKKNPSSEDLPAEEIEKEEEEDVTKNKKLNMDAVLPVFKKIGFYCLNLGLVKYFF